MKKWGGGWRFKLPKSDKSNITSFHLEESHKPFVFDYRINGEFFVEIELK